MTAGSALFDEPGPRGRRRHAAFGLIAALLVVAAVGYILSRLWAAGQFDSRMWEWLLYENVQLELLAALWHTVQGFVIGAALALLFGAAFAVARLSEHGWIRAPATVVVEGFRGVPLIVLMYLLYYGLPNVGLAMTPLWAVVVGLMLYNGSVLAEVFRGGILALPRGQTEAAESVGLRKSQVMRFVLLPQAMRSMLPAVISQLVVLLKDTALGFLITYEELLDFARYMSTIGEFGRPLVPVTLVVAAMYILMCLTLSGVAALLARRRSRPAVVAQQQ